MQMICRTINKLCRDIVDHAETVILTAIGVGDTMCGCYVLGPEQLMISQVLYGPRTLSILATNILNLILKEVGQEIIKQVLTSLSHRVSLSKSVVQAFQ